jgi:hypothetical protein
MLESMPATKKPAVKRGRPPAGRIKVMVSLEPEQVQALRLEAFRRVEEDPRARPDVSGLVREAVDAWLKPRRGRGRRE